LVGNGQVRFSPYREHVLASSSSQTLTRFNHMILRTNEPNRSSRIRRQISTPVLRSISPYQNRVKAISTQFTLSRNRAKSAHRFLDRATTKIERNPSNPGRPEHPPQTSSEQRGWGGAVTCRAAAPPISSSIGRSRHWKRARRQLGGAEAEAGRSQG